MTAVIVTTVEHSAQKATKPFSPLHVDQNLWWALVKMVGHPCSIQKRWIWKLSINPKLNYSTSGGNRSHKWPLCCVAKVLSCLMCAIIVICLLPVLVFCLSTKLKNFLQFTGDLIKFLHYAINYSIEVQSTSVHTIQWSCWPWNILIQNLKHSI